jgi:hypothetical protein
MQEYYFLAEKLKPNTAFAYTKGDTPLSHEMIGDVIRRIELPFELFLRKVTIGKGGLQVSEDLSEIKHMWLDYQPNNLAWPLMSEKMKDVIAANLTGKEGLFWVKAIVNGGKEAKAYFIPRFSYKLDVIDENKTIFIAGTAYIVRPVFSYAKVKNYSIFFAPQECWEITSSLYISDALKTAIQKEKLTGLDFEKTSVAEI